MLQSEYVENKIEIYNIYVYIIGNNDIGALLLQGFGGDHHYIQNIRDLSKMFSRI